MGPGSQPHSLTPGAAGYSQDGGRCTGSELHLSAGSAPPSELPHLKPKDTWVPESGPAPSVISRKEVERDTGTAPDSVCMAVYHSMTG